MLECAQMPSRAFVVSFTLFFVLFTVSAASLQTPDQPYRLTDREVGRLLDRIKNKTEGFRQALKKSLKQVGATDRHDINAYVKSFGQETKRLDDHFKHHKSTATDVDSVLQRGLRIDSFMSMHPLDHVTQAAWDTLRSDLGLLAGAYNIRWQWRRDRQMTPSDLPYRVSDREVEALIHRIESRSDVFRKTLDTALDKSRFDGTRREDEINSFVKGFYQETKKLHEHFDSHKSTSADVRDLLDRGTNINQFVVRYRLTAEVRTRWTELQASLDELATLYSVDWRWN